MAGRRGTNAHRGTVGGEAVEKNIRLVCSFVSRIIETCEMKCIKAKCISVNPNLDSAHVGKLFFPQFPFPPVSLIAGRYTCVS